MAAAHWARYLRKAHVEFCPFSSSASSLDFLGRVQSRKVRDASPKLEVKAQPLVHAAESAAQQLHLTYVDSKAVTIDTSKMTTDDIIETITLENGRLDMEVMAHAASGKSGNPPNWS
jgi:hypothetical protein